ncbi:MerR family DNA-binding transcriptional regulator [Streptomyces rubiginosohelvolus]
MFSSHDGLCTIGELAEHLGVSVKTVRFYSDRGRSSAGICWNL